MGFLKIHGTSRDFRKPSETLEDFWGFRKTSWDFK
jgi:hypothetical protein